MTKKLNEIKTTLNFLRNGRNATEQMTEETCLEVYLSYLKSTPMLTFSISESSFTASSFSSLNRRSLRLSTRLFVSASRYRSIQCCIVTR